MGKRVFVLGAGASIGHSDGLFPTINQFFHNCPEAFEKLGKRPPEKLAKYVKDITGKDPFKKYKINIEAILTHIDIEAERNMSADIMEIREQLLTLIKYLLFYLEIQVQDKIGEYDSFVGVLNLEDTIISFNWDLCLDNIMNRKSILRKHYSDKLVQDKGMAKVNQYNKFVTGLSGLASDDGVFPPYRTWNMLPGQYLKLHGSIDWFYCTNDHCRLSGVVFPVPRPINEYYCSNCHEPVNCLIIPPALNKAYRNYPFIRRMWNLAAKEIAVADELIIWGYSLPSTDFHSAWLLRQARNSDNLEKISIINLDVINKSKTKRNMQFVKKFLELFLGRVPNKSVSLYENFQDYKAKRSISQKYDLDD